MYEQLHCNSSVTKYLLSYLQQVHAGEVMKAGGVGGLTVWWGEHVSSSLCEASRWDVRVRTTSPSISHDLSKLIIWSLDISSCRGWWLAAGVTVKLMTCSVVLPALYLRLVAKHRQLKKVLQGISPQHHRHWKLRNDLWISPAPYSRLRAAPLDTTSTGR